MPSNLSVLFIGDVVGAPGRRLVSLALPRLVHHWGLGLVVCNAENSAGGSGITADCHEELAEAGVDVFTLGDHIYRKDDVFTLFAKSDRLLRAANFPPDAPGRESVLVPARDGTMVGVFSLMGRTFMKPVDCPFRAADRVVEQLRCATPVILVDVHAEATSEKQALGRYLDGRVSAVLGTHTHVPTADEQVFPGGTAYQTDVGMTGPYESIIGRRVDKVLAGVLSPVPCRFDVATGDPRLHGALIEVDPESGKAQSIRRVRIDQEQARRLMTDPTAVRPG